MASKDKLFRLEDCVSSSDSDPPSSPSDSPVHTGLSQVVEDTSISPTPLKISFKRPKKSYYSKRQRSPWLSRSKPSGSPPKKKIMFSPSSKDLRISLPLVPLSPSSTPSQSPKSSTPGSPDASHKSSTASRKITFHSPDATTPSTATLTIPGRKGDEETVTVSQLIGNVVFDAEVLATLIDKYTVCSVCKVGSLKLLNSGTRSCLGQLIQIVCDRCDFADRMWTLSGKSYKKISVGDTTVSKRNDSVYGSMLGGRLVGLGRVNLNLYHSVMGNS